MTRHGVLVVGSANMDLVVTTRRFPLPGETIFGRTFKMYPGGKGANQAVACSNLGDTVYFLGKMGSDSFGAQLAAGMKHNGVRMEMLTFHPTAPTGIAQITVEDSGQNQIIVLSGSNMEITPTDIQKHEAVFKKVRVLLVQLEIPLGAVRAAIRLAHKHGVTVVLNPAPARKLPHALLSMVDYLTPNETELQMLSGMPVETLLDMQRAAGALLPTGIRNVVVTLGRLGALLVNREGARLYPTRRVKAIDTTAAGDAFNGALAFALASRGNLDQAIHLSNAAATFSVTRPGAQCSMPTLQDLRNLLPRTAYRAFNPRGDS